MISKIFISYSRKDLDVVMELRNAIYHRTGVLPWMDVTGIETGSQFAEVIARAIDRCEIVIFVISRHSVESPWTRKEVLYAQEKKRKIYPVSIDDAELPTQLHFLLVDVDRVYLRDPLQCEKFFSNLAGTQPVPTSFCPSVVDLESIWRNADKSPHADELYEAKKRWRETVRLYQQAAESGDIDAQYRLGNFYFSEATTYGIDELRPHYFSEALRWLRMAADRGDPDAQCNLGDMYEYGWGVARNNSSAVKWWRKAARQGNVAAMRRLDEWEKKQRFSYKFKEFSLGTLCILMWLFLFATFVCLCWMLYVSCFTK